MIRAKKINQYISEIKPPSRIWVPANHFSARDLETSHSRAFNRIAVLSTSNTSCPLLQFLRPLIIKAVCHLDHSRSLTILWICRKSIQITVRIKNILIRWIWNYRNRSIPMIRKEKSSSTVATLSHQVILMTRKLSLLLIICTIINSFRRLKTHLIAPSWKTPSFSNLKDRDKWILCSFSRGRSNLSTVSGNKAVAIKNSLCQAGGYNLTRHFQIGMSWPSITTW